MATSRRTADTVDYSMQEKIMALYDLQKIDSKIDEINKIKGVLPTEVQDLEDEVAGLQTRIDNIKSGIDELNLQVKQSKEDTEQAKIQIAKYNEQQKNVRNNREFDAISKEIEYQELQIQLNDKHIKEYTAEIKVKKKQTEDAAAVLEERKIDLEAKRSELESIDMETADEMARLREEETRARAKIDERLLSAYSRIRSNVRNGLAVVTVKRDACGGCFNRDTAAAAVRNQAEQENHRMRILRPYPRFRRARPRRGGVDRPRDSRKTRTGAPYIGCSGSRSGRFRSRPPALPGSVHPPSHGNRKPENPAGQNPAPGDETARSVTNPQLRPTNSH